MSSFGSIFVVIALAWVFQLVLSLYQTKRFHKRVAELKRGGNTTSVGMAGSNWKLKVYGLLVVNQDRMIIKAEKLSGFTIFANLKPVSSLSGLPLTRLDGEPPAAISKKTWRAFRNAAGFIKNYDENHRSEVNESIE